MAKSKQLNTVEEVGSPELEDAEREENPFLRALDELSRQQQSGEGHKSPPPDSPSGRRGAGGRKGGGGQGHKHSA
uniref:RNA-binding protein n=1 Tax=Globodera pallida TaxID=36090 RepID=A0A183CIB9_GLOPA